MLRIGQVSSACPAELAGRLGFVVECPQEVGLGEKKEIVRQMSTAFCLPVAT
jgi:hypothetical protein